MEFNQESIDSMKEICRMHGDEISDAEASKALRNLDQYFELLYKIHRRVEREGLAVDSAKQIPDKA